MAWQQGGNDGVVDQYGNLIFPGASIAPPYPQQGPQAMPQYVQTGPGGVTGTVPPMNPANGLTDMQQFMMMMQDQMQQFMANIARTTAAAAQTGQPFRGDTRTGGSGNHGDIRTGTGLDERCFRRLERFSNKKDDWK